MVDADDFVDEQIGDTEDEQALLGERLQEFVAEDDSNEKVNGIWISVVVHLKIISKKRAPLLLFCLTVIKMKNFYHEFISG